MWLFVEVPAYQVKKVKLFDLASLTSMEVFFFPQQPNVFCFIFHVCYMILFIICTFGQTDVVIRLNNFHKFFFFFFFFKAKYSEECADNSNINY